MFKKVMNLFFVMIFILPYVAVDVIDAQDENTTVVKPEAEITAISASEIAKKIEETNDFVQKSQQALELSSAINEIVDQHEEYIKKLEEINIYSDPKKLQALSVRELSDVKQQCLRHKSKLNQWITQLSAQTEKIGAESQKTQNWIDIWEKTDASAREQKLPQDVVNTIKTVIQILIKQDRNLSDQLKNLLSIQNNISAQDILFSGIISEIEKLENLKQENLFVIDSEPFWVVVSDWGEQPHPKEQIQRLLDSHYRSLTDFYAASRENITFQIFTFLLLLILLILIKRYRDKWIFQTDAVKVLLHPFSQALLITFILSAYFYLQAPNIVNIINRIIIMILILRLLPQSFDKKFRRLIYGFTFIFFLQQFHLMSIELTLFNRLLILVISILSVLIILRIFSYTKQNIIDIKINFYGIFLILMRITMILLIISIISNIIGNVSLAEQLNYGALHSIYTALGINIFIQILTALFVTLLYSRYASYLIIVQKEKEKIKQSLTKILSIGGFIFWLILVLNAYGIYTPLEELIVSGLSARFALGSVNISLGDILIIIIMIWLSFWLSKLTRFILEGDVLPRIRLPRGVPGAISKLTHYFILGFGFVVALSAAGFDLSKFALIAGALGVGIGFGLQNIVNNFISGLILIFERPIQTGDVIELGDLLGVVKRIGIRASMIRTFSGAEVIVPNANLISNEVVNWTMSDKVRRIEIAVGVAYGTDPTKVLTILKNLTKDRPQILEKPEPIVLFLGFGDSSLNFELRFWTGNSETWLELKSQMTVEVHDTLKRAKIEIPFPQRDLHIKSGTVSGETKESSPARSARRKPPTPKIENQEE